MGINANKTAKVKRAKKEAARKQAARKQAARERKFVHLPEKFSLTDNYDAVIDAIDGIRDCGDSFSVNFSAMNSVSAAAALMLAAEMDIYVRCARTKKRLNAWGQDWHKNAGIPLKEMGFFELLGINPTMLGAQGRLGEIFIKFISGVDVKGNDVVRIIKRVEKAFELERIPPEIRMPMLAGMGEAILNTHHHAYNDKTSKLSRWWISASVDRDNNWLKVICYDRGKTIPRTLIGSPRWNSIKELLGGKEERDENIIHAAMQTQKTSTKKENRGHGLQELRDIIEANQQGVMEVYSRNGKVEYKKESDKEDAVFTVSRLSRKLHGTLVVWRIIPNLSLEKI